MRCVTSWRGSVVAFDRSNSILGSGGGFARLGEVKLVRAFLSLGLLDELRVVGEVLWQDDAALAGEKDEEHRERAADDDETEPDEALVEVLRAHDVLDREEGARVAPM